MIIPVTFTPSSSTQHPPLSGAIAKLSHNEVVLIEFQGELEVELSSGSNDRNERNGKLVGIMNIDEALTRPTLRIGHHHLEGKIATLAKPLAVLQRQRQRQTQPSLTAAAPDDVDMESQQVDENAGEETLDSQPLTSSAMSTSWEGIAIIKRKIIFSKRPMPIVGRSGTS
ncbi:hypothetical protein PM082_022644 [Marasmius tenuissimus]|nr:hypothetical protein PM082_022644 [Marasmius tenuissimus]